MKPRVFKILALLTLLLLNGVIISKTHIFSQIAQAQNQTTMSDVFTPASMLPKNYYTYAFCGDGVCAAAYGEDSTSCPRDCGDSESSQTQSTQPSPTTAPTNLCGDGVCSKDELANQTCRADCTGVTQSIVTPTDTPTNVQITTFNYCRRDTDCQAGNYCATNNQCTPLQSPVSPTVTPTPTTTSLYCRQTSNCPLNYTCNIPLSQCEGVTNPTVTNTPTPTTFICANDAVCPSNYVCDVLTRICVAKNTPTQSPTPTFTITPTLAPNFTPTNTNAPTPTFTNTPTPTTLTTNTPTPTEATQATASPTQTATPTTSPTPIEITQEPTSTPGDTILSLNLKLPAIGSLNCVSLPTASGSGNFDTDGNNCHPVNDNRSAIVQFINASDQKVADSVASLQFDGYSYRGATSANLESGTYSVYVNMDNTLVKRLPAILTITKGSAVTAPSAQLISGDIDQNNILDLFDWNAVTDCYNTPACGTNFPLSDLNDDGKVDEIDINILSRGFAIRDGDGTTGVIIGGIPTPTATPTTSAGNSPTPTQIAGASNTPTSASQSTPTPTTDLFGACTPCSTDANGNGVVDQGDSDVIAYCMNSSSVECRVADVNYDGVVNSADILCYQNTLGQTCNE